MKLKDSRAIQAGLFFMSLSTLLWEVLLTRIFSVLFYYHFAFLAVSIAMFGITAGTLWVLFYPRHFPDARLPERLGQLALATAALLIVSILLQLPTPYYLQARWGTTGLLLKAYALSTLPFIPAGAYCCLSLTRFDRVGRLYAFDLLGAGLGACLLPWLLQCFGGPGSVFVVAALCGCAALVVSTGSRPRRALLALAMISLMLFAWLNTRTQWVRLRWRHDGPLPNALHESWNAFSRIMITPFPADRPFTWGADPALLKDIKAPAQLMLQIDSGAGTPITYLDSGVSSLRYLRYDLTSLAYAVHPAGSVLIIGAGGGRDILTALHFDHTRVTAVEVNGNIAKAVNGTFGDFSGHLDRDPRVRFVVGEGRQFVESSGERYDIIQASLVDSAAATAAGAYSFVENGLYTREAWELFLRHLQPGGILTFSRWYFGASTQPVEIYRTLALGASALKGIGIADPARHILVVRGQAYTRSHERLATILISQDPFASETLTRLDQICRANHFEVAYSADHSIDPLFEKIIQDPDGEVAPGLRYDIRPTTDDRPFFFFQHKLSLAWDALWSPGVGFSSFNAPAITVLLFLLILSSGLSVLLILAPIPWLPRVPSAHANARWAYPIYFGVIGLAFMCVEIGWMQRLGLYLGHPTYGFTVSLTGILIFSGLGSYGSERPLVSRNPAITTALLVLSILIVDWGSRMLFSRPMSGGIAERIGLALALTALPAILMGTCFPLAMSRAVHEQDSRASWYWAINGAASVTGAVMATTISFSHGIRATLMVGAGFYLLAAWLWRALIPASSH